MENKEYDDTTTMENQQLNRPKNKAGGIKTMPFIIANEALSTVASIGLMPNMVLYLIGSYNLSTAKATNILFYQSAANNFFPLIGAFLSDSYIGRFLSIGFGSIFTFLGMLLIWLTAMIPQARPPHCENNCKSATPAQLGLLFSAFGIMAIGLGGIKPCSLAFGADQFDKRGSDADDDDDSPSNNNQRVLETFFTWYYASTAVSVIIAFTGIVYIQDHAGWKIGFGIPAIFMFFACLFFFLASSLYYKEKPTTSIFSSLARVVVKSYKNRNLQISDYNFGKDKPTNKLRCLNKACISKDGCTVEQVENLKSLIRIMPIWSAGIMVSITLSQGSFQVLQARSMDRHITKNFIFPSGSFAMFTIASAILWLGTYDRIIIPFVSKIKGKPFTLNPKIRMGLGLFFSILAMCNSAIVEHFRRRRAIDHGYLNNPKAIVPMSAMWLVPQHCLVGISEALFAVACNEFFYTELPKTMSSIAGAIGGLAGAIGGLMASSILNTVTTVNKRNGKVGWIADNINQGHFESYYWLLAMLSCFNLLYFMICSWFYGPCSSGGMFGTTSSKGPKGDEKIIAVNEQDLLVK
ncbi:protein NRT1/ PTR FAMILY 1.2-like [Impatiens glandulifera]|uniref:protein NRT1/ PTR FAMILY 1.2-like n=1 Tax=Impatiens glandulifera TaxID=253017 RepID=UPI001FB16F3D|nr:protein NRT1/ PTR FAMILY 1.2-like [Impatiens glandulifera]